MDHCPSHDLLDAFLDAKLHPQQYHDMESHIETCVGCQETLNARCESHDTIATLHRSAKSQQGKGHWYLDRVERLAHALRQAETDDLAKLAQDSVTMRSVPTLTGYAIEGILGRGGMGIVLKARHQRMQRDVAIKVLPESAVRQPSFIGRFYREAQAVARLAHPNIVSAYDAGEQDGIHYLVMEFVDGHDLEEILKRQGPLALDDVLECMIQAAQGLAYAHGRGIIHRDIKPANLLLQPDGVIKILDMGLARMTELGLEGTDTNAQFTLAGQIMGTVDFMAPEQALDTRSADARADIYSLGCTMFRLLTGASPFPGDTVMKKLISHRDDAIPKLNEKRPDIPMAIDVILQKMMAKTPDQRYESMDEVISHLRTVRDEETGLGVPNLVGLAEQANRIGATQVDDFVESYGETQTCAGSASTLTEHYSISAEGYPNVDAATSEPVTSLPETDSEGNDQHHRWPSIVAMLGGIPLLVAAVVLLIQTPHGVLKIEIEDPSIEVSVGADERLRVTGSHGEFQVVPGPHRLQIMVGDQTFQTKEFTIGKGDDVALRIAMIDNQKVRIIRDGKSIEELKISNSLELKSISDAASLPSQISASDGTNRPPSPNSDRESLMVMSDEYPGNHALWLSVRNEHYVDVPTLTASTVWDRFQKTGASTLEIWIQRDRKGMDVHEAYLGIQHFAINSAPGSGFIADGEASGRGAPSIRFRDLYGPLWHQEQASRWMHVAAVDELEKQRRLYINGKLVGSGPSDSDWGAGGGGKWQTTMKLGATMVGAIGEARISMNARYHDDFVPEFNFKSDEHTLALYHVNEGSGDILHDSSGNEHHGKIIGAKWLTLSPH
ncbi:serine/threonine protein kinase [Stieleria varia]|uniref:non-specific serine/threonine protein kinase n=2 Tax=Stieleria varia TaxID=2528005 RepID=A0A5C6B0N0_9BACT|nr:serine/threonine-protein kinase [Stieleria varia]TWU05460.1 Serine/threonine-protein kinase PknB [Stieleria varia]